MISNKILIYLVLEDGCSQDEGEVSISWTPINFMIYDNLFVDLIDEFTSSWLAENRLKTEVHVELIGAHRVEIDGGGAILGERFELINEEWSI